MEDHRIDIEVDEQFAAAVDIADLTRAVSEALRQQEVWTADVTVVITDDATVQVLNRDFRDVDAPTDVLSFPARDEAQPSLAVPPELATELARYLGDIVIAYPYAARQAHSFGAPIAAELRLLVVHGALHLLGHDHADEAEQRAMWSAQDAVLAALGDPGTPARSYEP